MSVLSAIILSFLLSCVPQTSWGNIDPKAKQLADEVVTAVHAALMTLKDRREELRAYSDAALLENEWGFKQIQYETHLPTAAGDVTYAFGLTVAPQGQSHLFEKKPGSFSFVFPYLDIKLIGYLIKHPLQQHLDIIGLVRDQARRLGEYEQQFLPLQLRLIPEKERLMINEPVRFTVELKNTTQTHMRVKRLGPQTLVFMYGDQVWGVKRQDEDEQQDDTQDPWVVLKAQDSLKLKLQGEGFPVAKTVVIYGIYRMGVRGVRPTAKMTLEIMRP